MILLISVTAGIIPMLIYPLILYWFDRHEKEPLSLVLATFVWGFVPAALFALISQMILDLPLSVLFVQGTLAYDFVSASIVAPITEEIAKGAALLALFIIFRREFDSLFDGVLYGSLVGFGFAAIENIIYFSSETSLDSLLFLIFLRAILFGLNHAFFTSLTGLGFAIARLSRRWWIRVGAPLLGLMAAIFMHAIHNAGATLSVETPLAFLVALLSDWFGALFVLGIVLVSVRRERSWIEAQLKEEVRLGTLSEAQYALVSSPRRRTQTRAGRLARGDVDGWRRLGRFLNTATELAYKKQQNARAGEVGAPAALIARLREQVAAISREV